jgi:crotonobetainyl-CoA:carnitine CoA-transferase CaiB-like acyl-CoA transferase
MSRLNHCLGGVRVLDLSSYLPGPFATLLLADFGAEVLKVEPPQGDGMMQLGPRDAAATPLFHAALNAGKTICRLDLKTPEGKAALVSLATQADVLIEGFRPGVMQRLGLDHATLRPQHPGLIYCSLSGYGANGPLSQAAGHDGNYLALAGVLHRNGMPPRCFDPPIADMTSGLFAVIAILGALQARRRDGLGCHIDLGIADVAMPLQLFQIAALDETVPQPESTYLNGGAAYYRVYATRDGRHVMLGAVEPKFWRAFCEAAERADWIARQQEPLPQTALIQDLAGFFATLSMPDCTARFTTTDCCVSAVLDLGEAVATPHHAQRGVVRRSAGGGLQALFPALIDAEQSAQRLPLTETGVMRWRCESSPE